jgi:hypothetical protein
LAVKKTRLLNPLSLSGARNGRFRLTVDFLLESTPLIPLKRSARGMGLVDRFGA